MSTEYDVVCTWHGDALKPSTKTFAKLLDEQLVIGERYIVQIEAQRNWVAHRAYMATVGELYKNWPESAERQFESRDHLRHWALIRTGHCTRSEHVCETHAEAIRLAAALRSVVPYCEIAVARNLVLRLTAQSQKSLAMGAKEFKQSCNDVIEFLCEYVGVTEQQLKERRSADRAARSLLPATSPVCKHGTAATDLPIANDKTGAGSSPFPAPVEARAESRR